MTNEELAILVRQGDRQAASALWVQLEKLVFKCTSRYFKLGKACGFEPEDLMQESFFALMTAVKYYDPAKGFSLSSYLSSSVRNAVFAALGLRNGKDLPPQPLSLDEQIAGDNDCPIYRFDAVEDETAGRDIEQVERDMYLRQLRAALRPVLDSLDPQRQRALHGRYWECKPYNQIAEECGVSRQRINQWERDGLAAFYRSKYRRQLEAFMYP